MTSVHEAIEQDTTLEEQCRRLGALLELDGPVSEAVLLAALKQQSYAHNLLTCRRAPALMQHLLAHPPRRASAPPLSTAALAQRATAAFARWARAGFTTVDDAHYQRRLAACDACPHLMEPDEHRTLYRAVAGSGRPKVCGQCGCVVTRKARLVTESCPTAHPEHPELTRWGESRRG